MIWQLLSADYPAALVLAAVVALYVLSRREMIWREAFRRLKKNRPAVMAVCVFGLFSSLAFLDSIYIPSPSGEPRTVVDAIFQTPDERTYSSPIANHTSGETQDHPVERTHLLGTDAVGIKTLSIWLSRASEPAF